MGDIAELAPHGRQSGGDDRLVECRQEHRQHDAEQDRADILLRQRRRLNLCIEPLVHENGDLACI
ncbi:hypothetical protein D3C72_2418890 [compost metagenome]